MNKQLYRLLVILLCLSLTPACSPKKDASNDVIKNQEQTSQNDTKSLFSKETYQQYKTINSDYIGHIIFESNLVNEPIVYSKTYDYLRKNINKQSSTFGTVYLDERNQIDSDTNLILYGHHATNKKKNYKGYPKGVRPMFSQLDELLDESNYQTNKTLYLYLENEVKEYVVAAVYYVTLSKDETNSYTLVPKGYEYYYTSYDQSSFDTYIKNVKKKMLYDTGVSLSYTDHLLTLQTCVTNHKELREIVVCKEVSQTTYS